MGRVEYKCLRFRLRSELECDAVTSLSDGVYGDRGLELCTLVGSTQPAKIVRLLPYGRQSAVEDVVGVSLVAAGNLREVAGATGKELEILTVREICLR